MLGVDSKIQRMNDYCKEIVVMPKAIHNERGYSSKDTVCVATAIE